MNLIVFCATILQFLSFNNVLSLPKQNFLRDKSSEQFVLYDKIQNFMNILQETVENEITQINETSLLCNNHFIELINQAKYGKDWAVKIMDSYGKPSSGILEGSLSFLGVYSECVKSIGPNFSGKYCLATVNLPENTLLSLEKLSGMSINFASLRAKLGTCVPSSCSIADINLIANKVALKLIENSSVSIGNCYQNKRKNILNDIPAITVIFVTGIIVILVLFGTICDHMQTDSNSQIELMLWQESEITKSSKSVDYRNSDMKTILYRILLAFSAKSNIKKIFDTSSGDKSVRVFHGIRVLSMVWVICLHSFAFSIQWMHFRNPGTVKFATRSLLSQILANGTFSVDCFFFISGFLVSYLVLKQIRRNSGRFSFTKFCVYRYLRMTPSMMAMIAFSATLLKYLGEGPNWSESITMFSDWCQQNWWLNGLYLHNFINTSNMCLSHSWYSAVDMQLYFISPIILVPLYRMSCLGISIVIIMLTFSMCITGYLTLTQDYPAVPYFNDLVSQHTVDEYYALVYIKPYCRIGPYLVGIVLAYCIITSQGDIKMKKLYSIIGWTISCVVSLGVLLAMMPAMNDNIPDVYTAALYSATSRTIWSLSLAWLTFACITGYGGVVNWFLSLKLWIPLSRLTYCAYLIHPIVMAIFYGNQANTFDFSTQLLVYFTLSHIFITYFWSFILSLIIETPISTISKYMMKRTS